jgi:hypothetical protein
MPPWLLNIGPFNGTKTSILDLGYFDDKLGSLRQWLCSITRSNGAFVNMRCCVYIESDFVCKASKNHCIAL